MTNLNLSNREESVKRIIAKFILLNGSNFVGIRGYENSKGEIANHVVIADFNYGNAVEKDLAKLQGATEADVQNIAKEGFSADLVKQAIQKLADSFIKNSNPETASNQSIAQKDTYTKVTNSIKIHNETGQIYIYALGHSKVVVQKGEYKEKNSRELTLAQNAVKKYFDLTTAKYRNFIVDENQLESVRITGDTITL